MEENTKKFVMVGIIVVCLLLAGAIAFNTHRAKGPNLKGFQDKTTWVLCRNSNCKAEYQMNVKDYFKHLIKHEGPKTGQLPPMICKECGEPNLYRAIKCEKCEFVFEMGSIPRDFQDRCPKCGYSKTEEDRKAAVRPKDG